MENQAAFKDTKQAAIYIGLSESTLNQDRMTSRLGIPYRKVGRKVLYAVQDLNAFMDRCRCGSTSEGAA